MPEALLFGENNVRSFDMLKSLAVFCFTFVVGGLWTSGAACAAGELSYPVVDTGQDQCYGTGSSIPCPEKGQDFFGQDAQYKGNVPSYRDNGDGTVTDLVTGLMWQKTPDFKRYTFDQAPSYAAALRLGGYADWRLPTIKELFSIADFNGNVFTKTPYIDTRFFDFQYPTDGERDIDAQFWSSNEYVGTVMGRQRAVFGFNFADGRIKGYPTSKGNWIRCVRGPQNYGINNFKDNGDGTLTDKATGLMWTKADNGRPVSWEQALAYAGRARVGGHSDWRLPNIKELQTIVDYNRSTNSRSPSAYGPAIDSLFKLTIKEAWLWSSTTHVEGGGAYYVAIGQGSGYGPRGGGRLMDVHGAGAVRSDPKAGSKSRYSGGHGPQKDEVRMTNYVILVRGGAAELVDVPYRRVDVSPKPGGVNMRQPGRGQKRGMEPGAGGFMKRFDKDGDGRVSRAEFDGPPRHFDLLDRNGDGYVKEDEAPTGPPPGSKNRGVGGPPPMQ